MAFSNIHQFEGLYDFTRKDAGDFIAIICSLGLYQKQWQTSFMLHSDCNHVFDKHMSWVKLSEFHHDYIFKSRKYGQHSIVPICLIRHDQEYGDFKFPFELYVCKSFLQVTDFHQVAFQLIMVA